MDYLIYAHLQHGEDRVAEAMLTEAASKGEYQPSIISAFHLASKPWRKCTR